MKYLKRFNESNADLPFRSNLLYKEGNIGKYEFYVDGDTGWGNNISKWLYRSR